MDRFRTTTTEYETAERIEDGSDGVNNSRHDRAEAR